jgi:hypothetical protein
VNIYDAIMKAADHINRNPSDFDFMRYRPSKCGTPGCALGWISFFAKTPVDDHHRGALPLMGLDLSAMGAWNFYDRMHALDEDWKDTAANCARTLRLYAEKHHGHEKPKPTAPDWNATAANWTVGDDVRSQELV